MTTHPPELRAEVLSWMAQNGRGYKAAGRHFGVPSSTVKGWRRAAYAAERSTPATDPKGPTEDPAPERPPSTAPPARLDESRRVYLERVLADAQSMYEAAAKDRRHQRVAREWAQWVHRLRGELDAHIAETEGAADEAQPADPAEVVANVLALVPCLVQVDPDGARRVRDQLTRELDR